MFALSQDQTLNLMWALANVCELYAHINPSVGWDPFVSTAKRDIRPAYLLI
jgi:hypothetical protein